MCIRDRYNIVRDKITTYAEFKQKFESRYWNSHTQRLLRNELEYGRYDRKLGITPENYIIQQVERAKHLTPVFAEIDIVTKLAYHFNHNIRVAVFTQGIRTVDELLILVSQSETVFDLGGWRYNPDFAEITTVKIHGYNTRLNPIKDPVRARPHPRHLQNHQINHLTIKVSQMSVDRRSKVRQRWDPDKSNSNSRCIEKRYDRAGERYTKR